MAGFVGDAWAIVLAGGDGRRLLALSRALYGDDRPKQFAVLDGRSSLLQATMIRIGKSIPPARTLVVVASRWEHLARRQLQPFAGVRIVVQPRNLDTGPGILLPLSLVLDEDPDARVVVFPSDHFVPRPESLVSATSEALAAVASMGHRTVLLGIASEGPETSYGWIVPGETLAARTRVRSVLRFVEKPSLALARRLHAAGAYWNSFVLVARAVTLWETARLHLPALVGAFEAWRRGRSGLARPPGTSSRGCKSGPRSRY